MAISKFKLPVGSYSFLNTYATCPYQAFRRYIVRDIKFVESPQVKHGNRVHTAFEYRLLGKRQLPDDMRQWEKWCAPMDGHKPEVEKWYGIRSDGSRCGSKDPDVWFRGKVDCTLFDIRTYRQAIIFDWKTGRPWEEEFELRTSAMLLQATHTQLEKIHAQYVWLKEDRLGPAYDVSDVDATYNEVADRMELVEADLHRGEFEKTPCKLCAWCSVKDCEHNTNDQN